MRLIEYDGVDFKVADEAFLSRPIRELYRKDKSKNKEEFWREISYMWFMIDPRSSYTYLIDETERDREVRKQEGLPSDWKPSPLLIEAMEVYKRQTTTTASLLLEDMRYGLDSIRAIIRRIGKSINADDVPEEEGGMAIKLDKALDSMTKAVDKIPDLAKKLVEAEKALAKDFLESDKSKGNIRKAIGEDV